MSAVNQKATMETPIIVAARLKITWKWLKSSISRTHYGRLMPGHMLKPDFDLAVTLPLVTQKEHFLLSNLEGRHVCPRRSAFKKEPTPSKHVQDNIFMSIRLWIQVTACCSMSWSANARPLPTTGWETVVCI